MVTSLVFTEDLEQVVANSNFNDVLEIKDVPKFKDVRT